MAAVAPQAEEWAGTGISLAEVEHQLAALQESLAETGGGVRTSVMTHIAWVPRAWLEAATTTLAGLAERHPSRTILLFPDPESDEDRIDARVSVRRFAVGGTEWTVCSEVVELTLHGRRAKAPASIVAPLLVADLPVFLRWRGEPPWGAPELEQLVDLTDRVVLDSSEWENLPAPYEKVVERLERTAFSDIAWGRGQPWRAAVARLWPGVAETSELRVAGPQADGLLLAGWLRSRLEREIAFVHDEAAVLELVALDGKPVPTPFGDAPSSSDLLSLELEVFGRDRIYEAAVAAAVSLV